MRENELVSDIESGCFDRKEFLEAHLPAVMEGLEISDEDTLYGNGEDVESLLLVNALMRHPAGSKEEYMEQLGRNRLVEDFIMPDDMCGLEKATWYRKLKKDNDKTDYAAMRIVDQFNLTLPIMEDEKVKKITERIYDKIIDGLNLSNLEKQPEDLQAKRKLICAMMVLKYSMIHQSATDDNNSSFFEPVFYSGISTGGLIGSLYQNNIYLHVDKKDDYHYGLFETAVTNAVDSYIKHLIITLCFKRTMAEYNYEKSNTEYSFGNSFIKNMTLDDSEETTKTLNDKKLNIFNIKKYLNDIPAEFLIQGILSTAIILFMKYIAQDDYLENERRKLRKEYKGNNNMCLIHKDELERLRQKNAELEKDVNQRQEKVLELVRKYGALPDDLETEFNQLKLMNSDYRKELYLLKKELESLKAEKEAAKNAAQPEATETSEEQECPETEEIIIAAGEVPDYIYNKKYIFLCTRDAIIDRLEDRFPNSVVSTDYNIRNVNSGTIDAVICLVRDISHPNYAKFKQKCRNMKIPFIDCNVKNTERIAQTIYEFGIEE